MKRMFIIIQHSETDATWTDGSITHTQRDDNNVKTVTESLSWIENIWQKTYIEHLLINYPGLDTQAHKRKFLIEA